MSLIVKTLGVADYEPTFAAMQAFTDARVARTDNEPPVPDELWLCEHLPVFTQGQAGKAEHVLLNPPGPTHIPVVPTNRGGQVTYHGPGQVTAYPLLDLKPRGYFVKEYVHRLEEAIIRTLAHWHIVGHRIKGAPGIYVRVNEPFAHAILPPPNPADPFQGLGKIAAIGIKVHRDCTLHGLALNVAMDLSPYDRINPCGYSRLRTVDMATLGVTAAWDEVADRLAAHLQTWLAS
jgi:lipoyl(octanoyl) transferase